MRDLKRTKRLCWALLLAVATGAPQLRAQPTLNGATLFQSNGSGNNNTQATFRGSWRTNAAVPGAYNALFLTPNPDASFSSASFYNNGSTALSRQLTTGLNTFYFYSTNIDAQGATPDYGLNLWFGTTPQSSCIEAPAISALARTSNNTFTANGSAGTTTQCAAPANFISGAGTLSTMLGGYTVTMQSFQIFNPGGGSGTPDRVGQATIGSDGVRDNYGVFTLNVDGPPPPPTPPGTNVVPEPSTYALMLSGLGALGFVARRRRRA